MALQYAIWTMATNGHDKYSAYHDAFHRRCRHYLQEDELRVCNKAAPPVASKPKKSILLLTALTRATASISSRFPTPKPGRS